jgi:hypothetical protein
MARKFSGKLRRIGYVRLNRADIRMLRAFLRMPAHRGYYVPPAHGLRENLRTDEACRSDNDDLHAGLQ